MWYRIVKAQTQGLPSSDLESHAQEINVIPEKFYPELQQVLDEIGMSSEQYHDLPQHAQKSIWDIIVHKLDKNTYNPVNDSDTPGLDAEQARRHSPFHTNPTVTTLEEQLEATRHDPIDSVPNNMQQAEKGKGGEFLLNGNGYVQRSTGRGNPAIFMDNLSSIKTMV